ncbi:hypothetical protein [Fibrobacter sp. HC4]|uniref:hypothetical protein n=1 Tax=Fibrobacter sp. HC4 TaxID=3239812 RepID=UPI002018F192|nr:hypothetical protein [Fibrobacter succinogenes]
MRVKNCTIVNNLRKIVLYSLCQMIRRTKNKKNNLLYYGVIVVMIDMEIFHVQKLPMENTNFTKASEYGVIGLHYVKHKDLEFKAKTSKNLTSETRKAIVSKYTLSYR